MSATAVPIPPLARGAVLKLWIGLALLAAAAAALAWIGTGGMQRQITDTGLQYRVVEEGTGEPVTPADFVALRYKLRLGGPEGQVLQDSDQTGQPFVTSTQGVFPGFAEGLQLMREGGHYQIWVPPALGYGSDVPPGAPFGPDDTLFFDIEVLQIARGMAAMQSLMGAPPQAGGSAGEAPAEAPPGNGAAPEGTP